MLLVQQLHDFLIRTGQTREDFAVQMGVNPSFALAAHSLRWRSAHPGAEAHHHEKGRRGLGRRDQG